MTRIERRTQFRTERSPEERVRHGATHYDNTVPGWWMEGVVDLHRFSISTPTACVQAQVEGWFRGMIIKQDDAGIIFSDEAYDVIQRKCFRRSPEQFRWEWEHGMIVGHSRVTPESWDEEIRALEKTWRHEIVHRRRAWSMHEFT